MKNPFNSILKTGLVTGLLFTAAVSNAQIVFTDNVNDVPAAPIDGFIGAGLVAGAYFILRKKYKSDR